MTETTHTPLPWVANDQHSGANPWRIESDDGVYANDGWIIAECLGPDAEANAALIVQAVNSHHRLVEALEDIQHQAETRIADGDEMGARIWRIALVDILAEVRAALKEAGRG